MENAESVHAYRITENEEIPGAVFPRIEGVHDGNQPFGGIDVRHLQEGVASRFNIARFKTLDTTLGTTIVRNSLTYSTHGTTFFHANRRAVPLFPARTGSISRGIQRINGGLRIKDRCIMNRRSSGLQKAKKKRKKRQQKSKIINCL